ncbi:MAG TPA: polyprenyl synthetase family protein [Ktedonobacteraceae bacterium]
MSSAPHSPIMAMTPTIQSALSRYHSEIDSALRATLSSVLQEGLASGANDLQTYYGLLQYHLGWVDAQFSPIHNNSGKLLRPTLLLLAYEAAGAWDLDTSDHAYLQRALPAAVSVELAHNFTLIHDDIEDGDAERRHRSTLWKLWGVPQAINAGDGMFALARLSLWGVLEQGVEGMIAARLGQALDQACLVLAEGQYLDISFEQLQTISVSTYIDMIYRKTGALMQCATHMGALLGTRDQETIDSLTQFGQAIGIAFQMRDDMLGVWASTAELGKTPAGDIYRRKKSLPILHALEHASPTEQQILRSIYQQESPVSEKQVEQVLTIFEHTKTRAYCRLFLAEHCRQAFEALHNVPPSPQSVATRARADMEALVHFIANMPHA